MNIIKFKDIFVEDQDWYNDNLRGKYAYWINCRYIVPLNEITKEEAVSFEIDVDSLLGYEYYILVYSYIYVQMQEPPTETDNIPEYPEVPEGTNIVPQEQYIKVGDDYYELVREWKYKNINYHELSRNAKAVAVLVQEVPVDPTKFDDKIIKTYNPDHPYIDQWDNKDEWILEVIDLDGTEKANSIIEYLEYNECIPEDVTLDQVKKFRSWLAKILLEFVDNLTDNQKHILSYYANEMNDDTVKWLTEFGSLTMNYNVLNESACGCSGRSNLSSLYNTHINTCDPILIYKSSIHNGMVQMFSDINFWKPINTNLLRTIVVYLKGILQYKLNLVPDVVDVNDIFTCKCLSTDNAGQKLATNIIENLIESFNYIIEDDVDGHKLTIQSSLNQWADKLYEFMEWN